MLSSNNPYFLERCETEINVSNQHFHTSIRNTCPGRHHDQFICVLSLSILHLTFSIIDQRTQQKRSGPSTTFHGPLSKPIHTSPPFSTSSTCSCSWSSLNLSPELSMMFALQFFASLGCLFFWFMMSSRVLAISAHLVKVRLWSSSPTLLIIACTLLWSSSTIVPPELTESSWARPSLHLLASSDQPTTSASKTSQSQSRKCCLRRNWR